MSSSSRELGEKGDARLLPVCGKENEEDAPKKSCILIQGLMHADYSQTRVGRGKKSDGHDPACLEQELVS